MERLELLLSATNPRLRQRLERIEAVDGRNISLDDPALEQVVELSVLEHARRAKDLGIYTVIHDAENLLVHFDDHLTEGAIACAMSHRNALERIASHPTADWGLVLEDDVSVVVPEVDRVIARILQRLPSDWQAVYLGYHHDDGKPHPAGLRSAPTQVITKADIVDAEVGGLYGQCWGLFALMVRKEAAQLLVDNLFPLDTQVDGAISNMLFRSFGPGRVFKVMPEELLFYSSCSEEAQDTDIQTMVSQDSVVEEYGSWGSYMQQTKRPSNYGYDGFDTEDMYSMFGDYGFTGTEEDHGDDDFEQDQTFQNGDAS